MSNIPQTLLRFRIWITQYLLAWAIVEKTTFEIRFEVSETYSLRKNQFHFDNEFGRTAQMTSPLIELMYIFWNNVKQFNYLWWVWDFMNYVIWLSLSNFLNEWFNLDCDSNLWPFELILCYFIIHSKPFDEWDCIVLLYHSMETMKSVKTSKFNYM